MALTKAEMAEALFNQLGLNKREARELVDLFFEEVRAALSGGEQVKLSGFGNFDLRDKNQRPGRNPKTGQEIPISARRVVTFRPGQNRSLLYDAGFTIGGARNKLTGEEARTDVTQSQQIVRQVRVELEELMKVLRRCAPHSHTRRSTESARGQSPPACGFPLRTILSKPRPAWSRTCI